MRCAVALVLGAVNVVLGASVETAQESWVSPLIIGGKPVRMQDVPYAIRIRLYSNDVARGSRYCGGVRLDRNWFLTTADCIDEK